MTEGFCWIVVIRFSLIAVIFLAGCAATPPGNPHQHPIVGTWVLNIAKTSPAAARDPSLAKKYSSTLTFSPDGEYRGVSDFGGGPNEIIGTFRTDGADVYLNTGNGETRLYLKSGVPIFLCTINASRGAGLRTQVADWNCCRRVRLGGRVVEIRGPTEPRPPRRTYGSHFIRPGCVAPA